jgi:hypothetical protein
MGPSRTTCRTRAALQVLIVEGADVHPMADRCCAGMSAFMESVLEGNQTLRGRGCPQESVN